VNRLSLTLTDQARRRLTKSADAASRLNWQRCALRLNKSCAFVKPALALRTAPAGSYFVRPGPSPRMACWPWPPYGRPEVGLPSPVGVTKSKILYPLEHANKRRGLQGKRPADHRPVGLSGAFLFLDAPHLEHQARHAFLLGAARLEPKRLVLEPARRAAPELAAKPVA